MEKLQVAMIIEILGRPAEHVKESLSLLIDRLSAEKGVKMLAKNINDPVPVQDNKDLFTTFADIEAELDSFDTYFAILFAYMPSHIEIIEPVKFSLTNVDFNELGNKLVSRLHEYDSITKSALSEREFFARKLHEAAPHLFQAQVPQSQILPEQDSQQNPKRSKKSKH